jgi:predicted nucleic acid-binding protein
MASRVADASFFVALLNARDEHHDWAMAQAAQSDPPWHTCEAVLSEAFHILTPRNTGSLLQALRRQAIRVSLEFLPNQDRIVGLLEKYADVPMSLADACLVRMTEILPDPVVLTADSDFRIYRRHGRQTVPCLMPR